MHHYSTIKQLKIGNNNEIFYVAFLPTPLLRLFIETTLQLNTHIPVLALDQENPPTYELKFQSLSYHHDTKMYAKKIHYLLEKVFKTKSVILILFKENFITIQEELYQLLIFELKERHQCVTVVSMETGNTMEYKNTLNMLKNQDEKNEIVVVFGEESEQQIFLNMSMDQKVDGRIWIYQNTVDLTLNYLLPNTSICILWYRSLWLCSQVKNYLHRYPNSLFGFPRINPELHHNKALLNAVCQTESIVHNYFSLINETKNMNFKDFTRNIHLNLIKRIPVKISMFVCNNNTVRLVLLKRVVQKCNKCCCRVCNCPPG